MFILNKGHRFFVLWWGAGAIKYHLWWDGDARSLFHADVTQKAIKETREYLSRFCDDKELVERFSTPHIEEHDPKDADNWKGPVFDYSSGYVISMTALKDLKEYLADKSLSFDAPFSDVDPDAVSQGPEAYKAENPE